jgi:SAM-dependent methyltransferase
MIPQAPQVSEQANLNAAEIYDRHLVPAILAQWTEKVLDAGAIGRAARVADIACGTGVLARAAASRVGADELVVGVDPNEDRLEVARNASPNIAWHRAYAENLPFADESFDAVVSQFGLMFFDDKPAGIREMMRTLRPGGRLVFTVWDAIERSPGFAAEVTLLQRICGSAFAEGSRVPFSLADTDLLRTLFRKAGIASIEVSTHIGNVHFPSIRLWVFAHLMGRTLAANIGHRQYAQLIDAAERDLAAFAASDGTVSFAAQAHVVVVHKR